MPPQYYFLTFGARAGGQHVPSERQITFFPHPYPELKDLQKQILRQAEGKGNESTAGVRPGLGSRRSSGRTAERASQAPAPLHSCASGGAKWRAWAAELPRPPQVLLTPAGPPVSSGTLERTVSP